jgi:hypothetical protein
MGAQKKIVVASSAIILAGCVYFAFVISRPTQEPQPVDPVTWKRSAFFDTTNDPGCFRGGMALDLVSRKTLSGKTGPEVTLLLGSPSNSKSDSWLYPVGQCGFLWQHHALQVTFGLDAKVSSAAISHAI